jgi:hypothetical protein
MGLALPIGTLAASPSACLQLADTGLAHDGSTALLGLDVDDGVTLPELAAAGVAGALLLFCAMIWAKLDVAQPGSTISD